ncbi:MAG: DUF2905 domain-containing protein [Firmicutes bacterium]|nr:DUF2905 domain-containing protein [Bacillota bacterium]
MQGLGRMLIVFGVLLVLVGLFLTTAGRLPGGLGRLPGDIYVRRNGFSFYFPLTTCIIISAILSLLAYLFRR